MLVTDAQLAALREFLGGGDAAQQEYEHLAQVDGLDGYGEFVYAAFVTAVRGRFGETWTLPEVVQFVATVRADLCKGSVDIEARAGENLIRRALGDKVPNGFDEETKGRAQVLLLAALVGDQQLDDADLDTFIAEAAALATRW